MISKKIVVTGKVQGVGFRYATFQKAMELGICGTVRNLDDGSVEILATVSEKTMNEFIEWCFQGPNAALVNDVSTFEEDYISSNTFKIVR